MKKRIILMLPIIVLIIIAITIINDNKTTTITFNTNIEVSTKDTLINSTIQSFANQQYELEITDNKTLTAKEEEAILKLAYNITNAFNDIENQNYVQEIENYTLRYPSMKLEDDFFENDEYYEWYKNTIGIEAMAWVLQSRHYTFEEIKDAVITYTSENRSIVQVYINNYTGTIGTTNYSLDAIFEYEIVFEESSNIYKVKSLAVEWVKDLDSYYQLQDNQERKQNSLNTTTLSNVSSYIPSGFTNFDYTKLEALSSDVTTAVYNKNKDSIVIIDSASKEGISTGSASGFFIRSGLVMTSYDSIYNMIENNAVRYYAVDLNDEIHEIEGIVAAYPTLNIAILKLKEEFGIPVEIGDTTKLEANDPIIVISSSIGLKSSIKTGIYFDALEDNYKIIRTSLPLIDGDSGSAVFNTAGQVIAVNTDVSTSDSTYNSGLNNATEISILKEIINKLNEQNYTEIQSFNLTEFNNEITYPTINNVKELIWNKYEELPLITDMVPLNLYSAYTNDNYLIVRYKSDQYNALSNNDVLNLYKKHLINTSYTKISDNVYQKDNITIRLKNNLGYLIVIVEGVV